MFHLTTFTNMGFQILPTLARKNRPKIHLTSSMKCTTCGTASNQLTIQIQLNNPHIPFRNNRQMKSPVPPNRKKQRKTFIPKLWESKVNIKFCNLPRLNKNKTSFGIIKILNTNKNSSKNYLSSFIKICRNLEWIQTWTWHSQASARSIRNVSLFILNPSLF